MTAKQDTLIPFYREVARYLRDNGIRSVSHVPEVLPDDSVLVHNFVRFPGTSHALGHNGFRAWLQRDGRERLEPCGCDFAAELGAHYRVVRRPGGLPI